MIGTSEIDKIVRERLKPSRYEHTKGALALALDLAERYGADPDRVAAAVLFHDIAKDCKNPDNNLSHGPEAAEIVAEVYGISDEDVLNAIRYHTTGRAHMSELELIVFLADTLEPGRTYEGVDRLRDLVYADLHRGALEVLKELHIYLNRNGFTPAKDSLEAIDWLEKVIGIEGESFMSKELVLQGETEQSAGEASTSELAGSFEESLALAKRVREIIEDKKGLDVVLLDISRQSSFADFFVNATLTNTRQLKTLEDDLGNTLAKEGKPPRSTEGKPESGWVLVDCGDVIVNLFLQAERDTYQIEKIWSDAQVVEDESTED